MQVLGERELLRQEVQDELANAADAELGPKFLHIVVKLADIESVYFNTASGRSLKFDQDTDRRPRSALTAALASSPRKENAPAASNRCASASHPVSHVTARGNAVLLDAQSLQAHGIFPRFMLGCNSMSFVCPISHAYACRSRAVSKLFLALCCHLGPVGSREVHNNSSHACKCQPLFNKAY